MSIAFANTGHRAHQNRLPVQSKYLAYKWDQIKYGIHRRRLTEVRKQIDNGIPYSYSLKFDTTIKKETLANKSDSKKSDSIDKENQRLHKKMVEIDSKGGIIRYSEQTGPKRFSSFKNHHYKTEMQRVAKENQRLLNRITLNEPMIQTQMLEKDYNKNHCVFQSNITRFPNQKKLVSNDNCSYFWGSYMYFGVSGFANRFGVLRFEISGFGV